MVKIKENQVKNIRILDVDGYGVITASGSRIVNVADPINPNDAATKDYVDDHAGSFTSYFVNSDSEYQTIQSAVDAAIVDGATSEAGAIIHISPGLYNETVSITNTGIALVGSSVFLDGYLSFDLSASSGFPSGSISGIEVLKTLTVSGTSTNRAYFTINDSTINERFVNDISNIELTIKSSIIRQPASQDNAIQLTSTPHGITIRESQIGRGNIDVRSALLDASQYIFALNTTFNGWLELEGPSAAIVDNIVYADGYATITDRTTSVCEIYNNTLHLNDPGFPGVRKLGAAVSTYAGNVYADEATAPFVVSNGYVRNGHMPSIEGVIEITGNTTLTQGHVIGDTTLLVNSESSVAITLDPISGLQTGSIVKIAREGAGAITFTNGSGVTHEPQGFVIPRYGKADLLYIGSNRWRIYADGYGSSAGNSQVQYSLSPTNAQTSFTLPSAPAYDGYVQMFVNGLKQQYGTDYSAVGTAVTYSGSLSLTTADVVEFWYLRSISISGGGSTALSLSAQSIAGNPTGSTADATSIALAENTILGRATGGNAAGNAPNDFIFANSTTSTKAGYNHVATVSTNNSATGTSTCTLTTDGLYLFTVTVLSSKVGGEKLISSYSFHATRTSGTLAGAELADPIDTIYNQEAGTASDTTAAVSFSNSSGNLLVSIANASGTTINSLVAVSYILHQYPTNPT